MAYGDPADRYGADHEVTVPLAADRRGADHEDTVALTVDRETVDRETVDREAAAALAAAIRTPWAPPAAQPYDPPPPRPAAGPAPLPWNAVAWTAVPQYPVPQYPVPQYAAPPPGAVLVPAMPVGMYPVPVVPVAVVPHRDVGIAYLLRFFFGALGVHHFYLGNILRGVLYLLTGGFLGVGILVDLFLMPSMTRRRNAELYGEHAARYGYGYPFAGPVGFTPGGPPALRS